MKVSRRILRITGFVFLLSGVNFMFAFACIYSSVDALHGEKESMLFFLEEATVLINTP